MVLVKKTSQRTYESSRIEIKQSRPHTKCGGVVMRDDSTDNDNITPPTGN